MGGINDWANEAREHLLRIEAELTHQSVKLDEIAKTPPEAIKTTKLNVVSEAALRTISFGKEETVKIYTSPLGVYTKLNHWAAGFGNNTEESKIILTYGVDGGSAAVLDAASTSTLWPGSNPNELVIPPNNSIYVFAFKSGAITMSLTTYELSV